jgi:hypothetical protein
MTPEELLLSEWRTAARAAAAAERLTSDMFIRYFTNRGEAPSQAQRDAAAAKRQLADDLYLIVIGGKAGTPIRLAAARFSGVVCPTDYCSTW